MVSTNKRADPCKRLRKPEASLTHMVTSVRLIDLHIPIPLLCVLYMA